MGTDTALPLHEESCSSAARPGAYGTRKGSGIRRMCTILGRPVPVEIKNAGCAPQVNGLIAVVVHWKTAAAACGSFEQLTRPQMTLLLTKQVQGQIISCAPALHCSLMSWECRGRDGRTRRSMVSMVLSLRKAVSAGAAAWMPYCSHAGELSLPGC